MERFVPHYTCKKAEDTGIVCIKVLISYQDKTGIYEKKITDLTSIANNIKSNISKDNPWNTPIIYDLASYAIHKGKKPVIVKESIKHLTDPGTKINNYSKKRLRELEGKGLKQEVQNEIEKELLNVLNNHPVMLFLNLNFLYNQRNAGLGWIIILEYNEARDEFIVYDPMYYTRIPRSRDWHRLKNTPKKRYISFKKEYLLKIWQDTKNTQIFSREKNKKQGFKPFTREFLYISS